MRLLYSSMLTLILLCASVPASAQDDLRTAFGPGVGGTVGRIPAGTDLQKEVVDQTVFPLARCNDNTAAIFYFRPASSAADANKWVINLQGGGNCGSGWSCSQRWFSVDTNFNRNNMTSDGFPNGMTGNGIFQRNPPNGPRNPIAGYNQVFLKYCSSDAWAGTAADVVVSGIDFRDPPTCKQYTISFLGRAIFDAVIATLRQTGVPPLKYLFGQGLPESMPDLDDAELVILSGGSAGAGGVIHNLDHLRDMLPGSIRVVGLPDSFFRPSKSGMDLSQTSLCRRFGACTLEEQNEWNYTQGPYSLWGQQNGSDTSCLSYHSADPSPCADLNHVQTDHVTTPYFVRMDLLDPGAVKDYQEDGIFIAGTPDPDLSTPEHEPLSEEEFSAALRAQILALASVQQNAHEGSSISVVPGAFSPECGEHDELRSDDGVYRTAIRWRGRRVPMFAVFEAWLRGLSPSILVSSNRNTSICPRP